MRNALFIVLAFSIIIGTVSCGKDEAPDTSAYDCTNLTPTYTNTVKAIFDASCAFSGCHGGGSAEEGVDLSSYSSARSASLNGKVLASMEHKSGVKAMPQGGAKLPAEQIAAVACWIKNGAPE